MSRCQQPNGARWMGCALLALALQASMGASPAHAHGASLEKKASGPAAQERGPNGGAVIDIGDGHFELTREGDATLALYRLDDDLHAIPAEDVDSAVLHAGLPSGVVSTWPMEKVGAEPNLVHFSVTPKGSTKGLLVVITVAMGEKNQNLRFLVH